MIHGEGPHIGVLMRWLVREGLLALRHGVHREDIQAVREGRMTGMAFLMAHCEGRLSDDDLDEPGNAFVAWYCGSGAWMEDYQGLVGDLAHQVEEDGLDLAEIDRVIAARHAEFSASRRRGRRAQGDDETLSAFKRSDEFRRARGDPDAPPVLPWRETTWGMWLGVFLFLTMGTMRFARSCEGPAGQPDTVERARRVCDSRCSTAAQYGSLAEGDTVEKCVERCLRHER